jgi:hypothetical protein
MYALIENNSVAKYPCSVADFKKQNPNISFPSQTNDKSLEQLGLYVVYNTTQPPVGEYQYLSELTPVFNLANNRWEQVWTVKDFTPEQIEEKNNSLKQANKQQAEQLLSETDWTQMPDVALVNKQAFIDYRATIRAIAINPTIDAVFPNKPAEQWS